ncbi:MAG: hypothetical protein ACOY0T_22550 [Myxococcota bacterium]
MAAVEKLYGPEVSERIRTAAPDGVGDALRYGGIVVGGWYPIEWYRQLWTAIKEELALDEFAARTLGANAAEISVNRVYRAFARIASPSMLLRIASSAFKSYFDTGDIRVNLEGSHALIAEWRGCTGFDPMIWFDAVGGATYFLGASGVSEPKVTILSGGGDEDWLIARGSWR